MIHAQKNLSDIDLLYQRARFMRAFEDALAEAADRGAAPGLLHLSHGAEILHSALARVIDPVRDRVTGSHRSHTLALAAGADAGQVAREILGRVGGLSDGIAGTQHLCDTTSGFLTGTGIVGSQVPLALGAAWSASLLKTGGLAITVLGDGAINQGAVLEAQNLARVMALPVLMVVENNGLAQTTDSRKVSAGTATSRARSFGFAVAEASVNDPVVLLSALARLAGWCREEMSPGLIEVTTMRLAPHAYAARQGNLESGDDPLVALAARLDPEQVAAIDREQTRAARALVAAAESAPFPGPETET